MPISRAGLAVLACAAALIVPQAAAAATAHTAVVKGTPVDAAAYPYAGVLTNSSDPAQDQKRAFCSLVLVRPTVALTAAHCLLEGAGARAVLSDPISDLQVVFGKTLLSDPAPGERIGVVGASVPLAFLPKPRGDVAVLHLALPSLRPAAELTGPEQSVLGAHGTPVSFLGWGLRKQLMDDSPRNLHLGMAKVARCNLPRFLQRIGEPSFLCEGGSKQRFCFGDSGGPGLTGEAAPGRPYVVGVVSTGGGCGLHGTGVFTSLLPQSPFAAWVAAHVAAPPDATAPAVTVTPRRLSGGPGFVWHSDEPVRGVCRIDRGPKVQCFRGTSGKARLPRVRGHHTLSVVASDESFNATRARVRIP